MARDADVGAGEHLRELAELAARAAASPLAPTTPVEDQTDRQNASGSARLQRWPLLPSTTSRASGNRSSSEPMPSTRVTPNPIRVRWSPKVRSVSFDTGMAAMIMQASITYDDTLFYASLAIAVVSTARW